MNRRNFLRNTGTLTLPLFGGLTGVHAAGSRQLSQLLAGVENDRVLVLIQLTGGNDGLNTLVPLDQLSNLNRLRSNVVLPQSSLLAIKPGGAQALHPRLTGFRDLFSEGKLGRRAERRLPQPKPQSLQIDGHLEHRLPPRRWNTLPVGWGATWKMATPATRRATPGPASPTPLAITMGKRRERNLPGHDHQRLSNHQ